MIQFHNFNNNKLVNNKLGNSHWSESITNLLIKLNKISLLRLMSIMAFKLSDEIFDLLLFTVSPAADHVLSTSAADAGTENIAHANFERRGMLSLRHFQNLRVSILDRKFLGHCKASYTLISSLRRSV